MEFTGGDVFDERLERCSRRAIGVEAPQREEREQSPFHKSNSWPLSIARAEKVNDGPKNVKGRCTRKSVSFTEVDYHVLIPTLEEYDKQTKDALWWTNLDIAQFAMAELRRRERKDGKHGEEDDDEESANEAEDTADEGDEYVDASSCRKVAPWGEDSAASSSGFPQNGTIVA